MSLAVTPHQKQVRSDADKEEELQEQHQVLQQQLQETALQLSLDRRAGAGKLKAAVEACLTNLAMSGSQFAAEVSWQAMQQVCCSRLLLLNFSIIPLSFLPILYRYVDTANEVVLCLWQYVKQQLRHSSCYIVVSDIIH